MHNMRTYSLIVAGAFVIVTSLTACGKSPIGPSTGRFSGGSEDSVALNGRVIGSELEEAAGLANALVTATREGSTYTTFTNASGDFEFTGLSAGEWTLSVSRDGYLDKSQPVNVDNTEEGVIVAIEPTPAAPIDEAQFAQAPAVVTR